MSRSRSWKEKCAVYIVKADGFQPGSTWSWPDEFSEARIHAKNLSLTEARAVVRAFNKTSMQNRQADVVAWDRQWAIACCSVRNKGWDRYGDAVPERPQLQPVPIPEPYKPDEIARLLAVCDQAELPVIAGVSPATWWRTLVLEIVTTGRRASKVIANDLAAWPHGTPALYATFKRLVQAAEVEHATGFHGLRLAHFQSSKGGVA